MSLRGLLQCMRMPSVRWSLVALVAVSVIPICALVVFQVWTYFEQEESKLAAIEVERARTINYAIDRDIDHLQSILRVFAATLPKELTTSALLHEHAVAVKEQMEAEELLLMGTSAQPLLSTAHAYDETLPPISDQDWSRKIFDTGKAGVSGIIRWPDPKRLTLKVSMPVLRDGAVRYVLCATMSPSRFEKLLLEQDIPPDWLATLFDGQGEVIAQDAEHARLSQTSITQGKDKARVLSVSHHSQQTQWVLVVGAPLDKLTESLSSALWSLLIISMAAIGVALVSAWRIGARISNSFNALLQPAISLARGEGVSIPPLKIREANEMRKALLAASVTVAKSRHAANHDSLTGLPNRVMFDFFLSHQMAGCFRQKSELSVLFIDLDGFKSINDAHGHSVGDELLIAVADRMQKTIRSSDLVARLGGDEFAFVLVNTGADQAKAFAERLKEVLSEIYRLGGIEAYISASIGLALYPATKAEKFDSRTLLNAADQAMYTAKKRGKNQVSVF